MKKNNSIKRPIYWLSGNICDCDAFINDLCKKYKESQLVVIDGTSVTVSRVLGELTEQEIFNPVDKIIRLKGLPPYYQKIHEYFKFVTKRRVLVIESPATALIEDKEAKAFSSSLYKEIKEMGHLLDFKVKVTPYQAEKWTQKALVKRFDRQMDTEALKLLIERCDGNLDLIYSALKKINSSLKPKQKITLSEVDVQENHSRFNIWAFLDDLVMGRRESAMKELEIMFANSNNLRLDIEGLFGAIIRHYELILIARDKCKNGVTVDGLKRACDPLKNKKTKNQKVELSQRYSDQMLRMFASKSRPNIGTVRLVEILDKMYECHKTLRYYSSNPNRSRLLLVNLVLFVSKNG